MGFVYLKMILRPCYMLLLYLYLTNALVPFYCCVKKEK